MKKPTTSLTSPRTAPTPRPLLDAAELADVRGGRHILSLGGDDLWGITGGDASSLSGDDLWGRGGR